MKSITKHKWISYFWILNWSNWWRILKDIRDILKILSKLLLMN